MTALSLDRETLKAAAIELYHARGLTPRDIAELLHVSERVVRELLLRPTPTREGTP